MSLKNSKYAHMNTRNLTNSYLNNSCDGFLAFKQRIEDQMVIAGFGLFGEDDDAMLRKFYRSGESEAYVLAALGAYN